MSALAPMPGSYCAAGRHFYPQAFTSCPVHKTKRWNVRLKAKHETFKRPDGSRTNEWTFQQEAETAKLAARKVVDSLFGSRVAAEFFILDVEVWEAEKVGIYGKHLWRGTAS